MRVRIRKLITTHQEGPAVEGIARGQSLAEFALVLPVFLLIVLMGIDFGRAFMGYISLQQTTRIAANFASINPTAWDNPGSVTLRQKYKDLIYNDSAGINCDMPTSGQLPEPDFPGTPDPKAYGMPAVVDITCKFHILTPIISAILPNPLTIEASSTFPIRKAAKNGVSPTGPVPTPCFSYTPTPPPTIQNQQAVQFIDTTASCGTHQVPTGWAWSFGDGATSAAQSPSHAFTCASGTCQFTVTLCAFNANGPTDTGPPVHCTVPASQTLTVQSATPAPVACFTTNPASPVNAVSPVTVSFTDTSSSAPCTGSAVDAWLWDFGDGTTSTSPTPPQKTYSVALGSPPVTYTVSLTVTKSGITSSPTTHTVTVNAAACKVPNFNTDLVNTTTVAVPSGAIWTKWSTFHADGTGGFSGTITYGPTGPPTGTQSGTVHTFNQGGNTYQAQSLGAGTYQSCASAITLNWK